MAKDKITIHNLKSSLYREIHVDGVFGGITPRGLLNLNFFAERFPIPKASDFEITDNQLGKLISNSIDSKEGILREFELGIYLDINVAKSLIKLLEDKVNELEKIQQKIKK